MESAEEIAREDRWRTALLRVRDGRSDALRAVLARYGKVSEARREPSRLSPEVRDLLARLPDPAEFARALMPVDREFFARADTCVIAHDRRHWPPLLAEMSAPPSLLFCRGDVAVLPRPQVAIVGSRHASPAGLATARMFAADLAKAGFVITSGLALGIDAMAHEGALAAGGQTVAVLGCGCDQVYPRRHTALAARIAASGCLVSEFLPGTPPLAPHFPQRNRIISALSLGVLVVEAAPDSGSLITARFAAEQGREVFAIPGSIHSPMSRGCHQLIREGATLVEKSADLIEALAHFALPPVQASLFDEIAAPAASAPPLPPAMQRLLACVTAEGCDLDRLAGGTGADIATTMAMLVELELNGRVHPLPGGRWQLATAATQACAGMPGDGS